MDSSEISDIFDIFAVSLAGVLYSVEWGFPAVDQSLDSGCSPAVDGVTWLNSLCSSFDSIAKLL